MIKSRLIRSSSLAPVSFSTGAYANTLTALIPQLYAALDVVSRELVGFIPSASRAPGVERAAVGQSVAFSVAPVMVGVDVAPAMQIPEPPDVVTSTNFMTITKSRAYPFGFTGEDQLGLNSGGPGYLNTQGQWIAQALRGLCNEIETDGAVEASNNASRAYGTAGTTPFASDLSDTANVAKILDDNGAPPDRSLVINTTSTAKMRTLTQLTKANEAGSTMTLRQGELLDIHGFSIKQTGQPQSHVKGTAASATTSGTLLAVGTTVIPLAAAGTGTVLVGDFVTFAGDTNKYNVVTGNASVAAGGSITLALPGLRVAIPASATALTVGNNYTANVAFSSNALAVAMRPPAIPEEGDARLDSMLITDPRSGITFEVSVWPGYRKIRAEIALAWGWKATKREHIAMLLG